MGLGLSPDPFFAFSNATSLKVVRIASSINKFFEYAFNNCSSLEELGVGHEVSVGHSGFRSAKIPAGFNTLVFKEISEYSFYATTFNSDLRVNGAIQTIPSYAFYNARVKGEFILEEGIKVIDTYGLKQIYTTVGVTFPKTTKDLRYSALSVWTNNEYVCKFIDFSKCIYSDEDPTKLTLNSWSVFAFYNPDVKRTLDIYLPKTTFISPIDFMSYSTENYMLHIGKNRQGQEIIESSNAPVGEIIAYGLETRDNIYYFWSYARLMSYAKPDESGVFNFKKGTTGVHLSSGTTDYDVKKIILSDNIKSLSLESFRNFHGVNYFDLSKVSSIDGYFLPNQVKFDVQYKIHESSELKFDKELGLFYTNYSNLNQEVNSHNYVNGRRVKLLVTDKKYSEKDFDFRANPSNDFLYHACDDYFLLNGIRKNLYIGKHLDKHHFRNITLLGDLFVEEGFKFRPEDYEYNQGFRYIILKGGNIILPSNIGQLIIDGFKDAKNSRLTGISVAKENDIIKEMDFSQFNKLAYISYNFYPTRIYRPNVKVKFSNNLELIDKRAFEAYYTDSPLIFETTKDLSIGEQAFYDSYLPRLSIKAPGKTVTYDKYINSFENKNKFYSNNIIELEGKFVEKSGINYEEFFLDSYSLRKIKANLDPSTQLGKIKRSKFLSVLQVIDKGNADWSKTGINKANILKVNKTVVIEGIEYGITNNAAIVIDYDPFYEGEVLNIKDNVEGKQVISIVNFGLYGNSIAKKIVIPSTIKHIGYGAFNDCKELSEIEFKDIKKIDSFKIDPFMFNGTKLSYLKFGNELKDIKIDDAMSLPTTLREISLPLFDNYKTVNNTIISRENNYIIKGSSNATIKYGVLGIASSAYEHVLDLNSITIPGSVKEISDRAFYGATFNDNSIITLQNGVEKISEYTFAQIIGNNITIIIPSSVKTVSKYAFEFYKDDQRDITLNLIIKGSNTPSTWEENWNNQDYKLNITYN